LLVILAVGLFGTRVAVASTAAEIDAGVTATLSKFQEKVKGSDSVLKSAKGVLVFPSVVKAGLGVGGEYGEGALMVGGKTVNYYSTAAASVGLQAGVQEKSIIIAFLDADALKKFRDSAGWKIGVDGSVAVVEVGGGGSIDTETLNKPIVGFVLDNKGLMYNLTLEGSKITKIERS
jgi:lipid-binding SYLF domain-containing protein